MKPVANALVVGFPLAMAAWLMVDVVGLEIPEWVVTALGYLFGCPLLLLSPLIPASDNPNPSAPLIRNVLYLVAIIFDSAAYSLLIYAILYWRKNEKQSRELYSGLA